MRISNVPFIVCALALLSTSGFSQVNAPLPGRVINKLLPDYLRPKVYALNRANGSMPGTLLALNPTNGAMLGELAVNLNPTDMAITPAGDALFVINAGSRTITKVDLTTFTVAGEKTIVTPQTYSTANPLYVVAGPSGRLYYTDGAWGPGVYFFDYNAGTNLFVLNTGGNAGYGAGGMALNRAGTDLYGWRQYGWGAGNVNSWVTHWNTSTNGDLTQLEESFTSWRRDPTDTPVFLDGAERWVFNKQQMFAATNLTILLNQFADNIYGISLDGSIAFGPTQVFNTVSGAAITNLPFSTIVQSLTGDQKRLFRYNASTTNVVIYDMSTIASINGPNILPTPADGAVVSLPLTNLQWSVSPLALAYDVYFGTNQSQVAGATNGSPQFLGRVTTPPVAMPQPLAAGVTYYWRLDVVGFGATNTGPVWSFTTSTLSVAPAQLTLSSIAGYNPASVTLNLGGAVSWTSAVTGGNWISLSPTSGASPGTVTVNLATAALAAGQYTNNIEFTIGATKLVVPVSLTVKPLNITKFAADRKRPYIYAIQPPSLSGQNGLLLCINTSSGNIDKTLTIGVNPVDLSVNDAEDRLYIASWGETWTYVIDLATQTLLPSLNLGTDIYKINAGRQGRLVTDGYNQWVNDNLINTTNGATLASIFVREGDGAYDPTGRYYYRVDNNISSAGISKYDMDADTFVSVAGNGTRGNSYYGSRNLVISSDGSRLFWTAVVFDAGLTNYGVLPAEIYACSTNGRIAFGPSQAYDSQTLQAIYTLPTSTTVSIVDAQNQRFWYFANGALGSVPMSVIQTPSITAQPPATTSVMVGNSVYFTVTATGIAPLTYQWMLNGTNVPGFTNYFLSLPSLQPGQAGPYRVIVSNPFGSVTSSVAQVNALIPPSIVTQPLPTNVFASQSFSLSVAADGSAPLTYRWLFENTTISGATAPALTVANAQVVNQGIYRAIVMNSVGSVTSAPAFVRILPAPPTIVSNPVSVVAPAASSVSFTVSAIGSQPLSYQWFFNASLLPGTNGATLSLPAVQATNAGNYFVVVANSSGSVTSTVATLAVTPVLPFFTTQPLGATVAVGTGRALTVAANGSQPITYQWQFNGTNIPGAVGTSLSISNLALADSGNYTALASNLAGVSTSAVAQVTVYQTPTVVASLSNQVADVGDTVLLSVNVVGSGPLGYAWQFNGASIPGNTATLLLTNIQLAQSGYYRVTVTNQYGTVSSTGRVSVLGTSSSVLAWGDNSGGQTNVPPELNDVIEVAGGDYHSIALRHAGTVIGWGYNGDGQITPPTNTLRLVDLAAGAYHNLAITERGGVVAWGRNDYGQRNVPATATNYVLAVAAGDAHSLALLASGTVIGWGDNSFGQISIPQGLAGVRAIFAGRNHSLALRTNGVVVGWGFNTYGQATPPASLTNAVAVAAGYLHGAALRSDGTVVCWGDNTYGQTNVPAGLSNVVAIAAGDFHTYARRADGSVVGWGDSSYVQLDIPAAVINATTITSGNFHGLALVPTPVMKASFAVEGMLIEWSGPGVLQWAPSPAGPFQDVNGAGNCYTNQDMTMPAKFFRVRR